MTNLHFDAEGKFRILTFSDIHAKDEVDTKSISLIKAAINLSKPHLIVLLGDQLGYLHNVNNDIQNSIANFMAPITASGIPFALVFGNHDPGVGMSLEDQMKIYQSYPNCLAENGPEEISGCGNYNLLIKDSKQEKTIFNIWFADSGSSDSEYIKPDQVEWYNQKTKKLSEELNEGKPIKSIWFQHRAVEEIYQLFDKNDFPIHTTSISKGYEYGYFLSEKPDIHFDPTGVFLEGPDIIYFEEKKSHLYSKWVENNDVICACFGHNHGNSFLGYTKDGIGLGFDSTAGWLVTYSFPGLDRGARLFEINEKDTSTFYTQMLYYGQIVPDAKIDLLTRMITYGNLQNAFIFLRSTLIPRPLQKYIGKKILEKLKNRLCPEHLR
ncbi:phosphohydrolase [Tritrichomonas foetus]|uniref:Phosphohydrolase n=1 Tax=Tritrichomonas foetus TaxID=1144522 RepID=A0A1J4L0B6_9EUKA|nr:phosphohydrolase [Tritrichomonas foetus]|eukprot:OHT16576.1 phosphohydrolase [Tritrichomonas foetus]